MKETQKSAILRYMKNHKNGITTWTAMNIGVARLSERIRELEADGHKIIKHWSECRPNRYGNPVRVMIYKLK